MLYVLTVNREETLDKNSWNKSIDTSVWPNLTKLRP